MNITIEFYGQLRHLADTDSVSLDVEAGTSIPELVTALAKDRCDIFKSILFDPSGALLSSALILMGDEPVDRSPWPTLKDGDVMTLLPPLAGG